MLLSLVIQLEPLKNGRLPGTTGPALHAAFFRWLTGINPAQARQLHDLRGPKPFTVSNLQVHRESGETTLSSSEIELKTGQTYWFRLTSFDPHLSELLLRHFMAMPPATFEILHQF